MDPNYKLPKSVIEFYKPYENKSKHIKLYKVMSTRFEMDDYYEIIDSSINFRGGRYWDAGLAEQSDKELMGWWWRPETRSPTSWWLSKKLRRPMTTKYLPKGP